MENDLNLMQNRHLGFPLINSCKDAKIYMRSKKSRCVLLLTILLLIGFLFTSFVSYYTARDSISAQITNTTLPLTSDNIYSEIQRDLLQPIFISSMMANNTLVRNWVLAGEKNTELITQYLKEIQVKYDTVSSFFVSDNTRIYYHSSGVLKTVKSTESQDSWYFRVRRMHNDYEINVDIDTADLSTLAVFINHRMYDYQGNYIGATGIGLAMNAVKASIEDYKNRYNSQVYFTDANGTITLQSFDNDLATSLQNSPNLAPFTEQILSTESSAFEYTKGDVTYHVYTRFIPEFNWHLIIEQQEDLTDQNIRTSLILNLAVGLFISLVIILLVTVIISGYQKKIEAIATTDKLTDVANRQLFDLLYQKTFNQSKRTGKPLAAIMLDIDYFKQVNDTLGHPAGDQVLKSLAQLIQHNIRASDVLFRWGGEEFLILVPSSDMDVALAAAEKIRLMAADLHVVYGGEAIAITVSCGVAMVTTNNNSMEAEEIAASAERLISHADKALYAAKDGGRNQVTAYQGKE